MACQRRALEIAEESLREVLKMIAPGARTHDVVCAMAARVAQRGGRIEMTTFSDEPWLDSPPCFPSERGHFPVFESGKHFLFDILVSYKSYFCDIAPVFCLGSPSREAREQQEYAWRCQYIIAGLVKPGMTTKELFDAAQDAIKRTLGPWRWHWFQWGNFFGWQLHGTGLSVHEEPMCGTFVGSKGYRYAGLDEPSRIPASCIVSIESMCESMFQIDESGPHPIGSLPRRLIEL